MTNNLTHIDFTKKSHTMQLKMKFDVATYIPMDSKVRLVCNIIEEMNLDFLLRTYSVKGRKPVVDPVTMLKVLLFCYSEGICSCRKIEDFCTYDTRAHFLLDGCKPPDHTTINRFRKIIEDFSSDLLTQFVELLLEDGHVNLKNIYIDGTKIESVAGRYTFVWRKSVEKYQKKLKEQLIKELCLPENSTLDQVTQKVEQAFNLIRNICSSQNIVFVHGIGKRKTQQQRDYEHLEDTLTKLKRYEAHLRIMGERNSYSKTDHDATFMRMKEDHMLNGQLKPAYNIQFASSGAFIVGVMGSQKGNDLHTLKPFLEKMMTPYGEYLMNIVADAGYESTENYTYLNDKWLRSYIKPANYEIQRKKKYKEDIGKKESMTYLEDEDAYLCKNDKKLVRVKDRIRTYASGLKDTLKTYSCIECRGCPYNSQCIKSKKAEDGIKKTIQFSPEFEKYRNESYNNITTEEGIIQRMNRSIQAEGMFSKLKDGLKYDRFRHRGMKSVVSDITLMALGINLNKFHSKMKKNQFEVIEYKKVA
ncbi:IS1182 family transposase [Fusibacter bizertensis]|uniref:IS1182 family transposase n=2 Tax=Fusibacter bizertensis TaxID=1488331 RepID=A0ABT6NHQ4_9FIRM|nr:IS1182 family transposase [Fusibacter bizertensis]